MPLSYCASILTLGVQDQMCIWEAWCMEDKKKTFGAYILQRRKELGMTQKAFAEKLYVTESAVSKWERGIPIIKDVNYMYPFPSPNSETNSHWNR